MADLRRTGKTSPIAIEREADRLIFCPAPKLLSDQGIQRAINVLIARGGEGRLPFGVLEVDSPESGQFDVADADFLAGFAGLLGIAIERQHADADLREALRPSGHTDARDEPPRQEQPRIGGGAAPRAEPQRAVTEFWHAKILRNRAVDIRTGEALKARGWRTGIVEVRDALSDAASRITTIAQVHDHFWRSTKIGFVDIADFASELCRKLQETVPHTVCCTFGHLIISADKAIPLGLLINELIDEFRQASVRTRTDTAKSRYRANSVTPDLHLGMSDRGIGLPKDFGIDQPPGEPGLQSNQEPPRSTRRTHCSGLQHATRRNRPA